MSTSADEQAEARFDEWNEKTQGGIRLSTTPKSKGRLLHNLRLELGAMKVREYGVTPMEQTLDNILELFTSYHQQQLERAVREAQLKMANNLIDQERKLYKIFDDDKQICVGIKEMADEVREYYDGGIYAKN